MRPIRRAWSSDAPGYVGSPAALGIGITAGALCNFSTRLKVWLRVDDALDIVAAHLVGGFIGNTMTGIFADKRVASFDGSNEMCASDVLDAADRAASAAGSTATGSKYRSSWPVRRTTLMKLTCTDSGSVGNHARV